MGIPDLSFFWFLTRSLSFLQLKRASSDDMLTKPGVTAASGVSRLKKTITTGAISELAENRLKSSTGKSKLDGGSISLSLPSSQLSLSYDDLSIAVSPFPL